MRRRDFLKGLLAGTAAAVIGATPRQVGDSPGATRAGRNQNAVDLIRGYPDRVLREFHRQVKASYHQGNMWGSGEFTPITTGYEPVREPHAGFLADIVRKLHE